MRPMPWILLVAAIAVAACNGKGQAADRAQPAGQQGMGGQMGMGGSAMMPIMRAHMDSLMRMSPEQMSGMLAAHDRMMSQTMDRMGADMRGMNMSADAKWNSLVDSVNADLAGLPGLHGEELGARMTAHADRMQRLIAMHEGMMKGM